MKLQFEDISCMPALSYAKQMIPYQLLISIVGESVAYFKNSCHGGRGFILNRNSRLEVHIIKNCLFINIKLLYFLIILIL